MARNNFDVLVVYSAVTAGSAASSLSGHAPFLRGSKNESYNLVYGYFLEICRKYNLKAAFTTSSDIVGAGKCGSYWLFENNCWSKVKKAAYSNLIFDKFLPVNKHYKNIRKFLFSSEKVRPFNPPCLLTLFSDKYQTYKKLKILSIPTVKVKSDTKQNIQKSLSELKILINEHPYKNDFSDEIVMKDRFGAGGKNVFKFTKDNLKDITETANKIPKKFIFQPYVKFSKGFKYKKLYAPTDIRCVFLGGKIIQTYLRIAAHGEFRCNEHRGGSLIYVSKKEIPGKITDLAKKIAEVLGNKDSLFSLDFIISNNRNIYFLEGNISPGLDWNTALKVNENEAKKLIRLIVKEIEKRSLFKTADKQVYKSDGNRFITDTTYAIPAHPTFV